MPTDLADLEATVQKMRALGVTEWNGIKLGPAPTAPSDDSDQPSESKAKDPMTARAERQRIAALASGGPVKLGDRPHQPR